MGSSVVVPAVVSLIAAAGSAAATYYSTPRVPMADTTDYELLRQTQEQANAESDAARARMDEAKKREELRQQQMFAQDVLTSEVGADVNKVGVKNQVLGDEDTAEDEVL